MATGVCVGFTHTRDVSTLYTQPFQLFSSFASTDNQTKGKVSPASIDSFATELFPYFTLIFPAFCGVLCVTIPIDSYYLLFTVQYRYKKPATPFWANNRHFVNIY